MPEFNSLDDIRSFIQSQPFDKELERYKTSLYPKDKLLFDKKVGPCYNYILDWQTGNFEYFSDGFIELLGYDEGFLDRGIEAIYEIMHPNDTEAFQKITSKWMALLLGKTETEFNKFGVSFNFRLKKRNEISVNVLLQPVYTALDSAGNIVYDSGMLSDISRFRTDGNLSLVIINPEGIKVLEYYPKEDFAPRIATARDVISELDRMASQSGSTFLRNVQKVLANHVHQEDFSVGTFSQRLGLSRSQLYRNIKKEIGLAPRRLIRLYRLYQSLEYLAQHELQISEVAHRVGFQSHTYFSHCFNKEFECSPSTYQKQVR